MIEKGDVNDLGIGGEPPKASHKLTIFGVVITAFWLVAASALSAANFEAFARLDPNEWGDFLAGVFAPLAFLWLVLGFFQQGEELRHSGRALWMQGRELQHSVEQQKELVAVTREQLTFESQRLEHERLEASLSSRPVLSLAQNGSSGGTGPGMRSYSFRLLNQGKPCTALQLSKRSGSKIHRALLATGQEVVFAENLPVESEFKAFEVVADYLDQRNRPGQATFQVSGRGSDIRIVEASEG